MIGGDIPQSHRELLEELRLLENAFHRSSSEISPLTMAKGLVCMSHDYFQMDMEEEGERLLSLAEKKCPGYFQGPILSHMEIDEDYRQLIEQLKVSLALRLMTTLGYGQ